MDTDRDATSFTVISNHGNRNAVFENPPIGGCRSEASGALERDGSDFLVLASSILRRAGAWVLVCVALLATPLAAHGGPNDATLSHFQLKDSSGKILPLVRPFDKAKARHYAYYTTFDSMAVVEAIPTDQEATVRFTRRPIVLESLLWG